MDICALFHCLCQVCSVTLLHQLSAIIAGALCVPHTLIMREIARWSACRYRTVQRFFAAPIPWVSVHATFFIPLIHDPSHTYILAFDETTIIKSGTHTHGIDRFYAGVHGHVVTGLAYPTLAVVDVNNNHSYPVHVTQITHSHAKKPVTRTPKSRSRARPRGRRNKLPQDLPYSPELARIDTQIAPFLHENNANIPLRYIVYDGQFSNIPTLEVVHRHGLHIITK